MRARLAHAAHFCSADRVLLLGVGDARFLKRVSQVPARLCVLDRSLAGLLRARALVRARGERCQLVLADVEAFPLREQSIDTVATHFFLDQWQQPRLQGAVAAIAGCVAKGGQWIDCDFEKPDSGLGRLRAQLWLPVLYAFFRWVVATPARELESTRDALQRAGMKVCEEQRLAGGFVVSRVWRLRPSNCQRG